MRDFKFFRGYGSTTLNTIDVEAHATASFNADTPESYMNRRMLYHTNRDVYERLNNPVNNNEMERYYYDRGLGRFETVRPTLNQEEVTRRINGGGTDIRLFQTTTVTTVNPKWWMKIKIFIQEEFWFKDPTATIAIAGSLTILVILSLAKILNVW